MTTAADVDTALAAAYARCEAITNAEARNFSYGIRLLPPPKRRAMSAVYALARRIDDVGDGALPIDAKLDALAALHASVDDLAAGRVAVDEPDPVLRALADAARRFPIPVAAFHDLVAGCERDARGAPVRTADDLVGYCQLVAGSVGRLSLGVFTVDDWDDAAPRADALGVALQLTNILRDIVEDRDEMGRIYLPAEDVERFGCAADLTGPPDAMAALVLFEAARAEEWYERGATLLPLLDRRSRACVAAMAGIYRRLLGRIRRRPLEVLERRVSLPAAEKAWVAARSLAGGGL